MDYLWALVMALVVAVGLIAAMRARRGRDDEVLAALGFHAPPGAARKVVHGRWGARALSIGQLGKTRRVSLTLAPAPLAYALMARALGRGELLAALHQLAASAEADRLVVDLAPGMSAKGVRRQLDRVVALADTLEALPQAEAMARWFLELSAGSDRTADLQRLLEAYPDAPETLAACRAERDQPRDGRSAALARQHLERSYGRAPNGDI